MKAQATFALALTPDQLGWLGSYGELLLASLQKLNLVSAGSLQEIAERHLLDSLAAVPLLGGRQTIVDLGSGAGLPGIPLAVALPGAQLILIESRRRRANFVRHALRTIGLDNVEVVEGRGENWPGAADAVVGRGVRLDQLAEFARGVLRPGGALLVWVKQGGAQAPAVEGFAPSRSRAYRLPAGERHEVRLYERST